VLTLAGFVHRSRRVATSYCSSAGPAQHQWHAVQVDDCSAAPEAAARGPGTTVASPWPGQHADAAVALG